MEAIRSSETSVLTRATRRNIPEYGILRLQNTSLPFAPPPYQRCGYQLKVIAIT
jgi:hypothetical protein